jgi:hypothetical protein
MRRKKFILARQPHEAYNPHKAWSPIKPLVLALFLVGLAFPMKIDGHLATPSSWAKAAELGFLRVSYGWTNNPFITKSEAAAIYTSMSGKMPKIGCFDAQEKDWLIICQVLHTQGMDIDCGNTNITGKTDILRNLEQSSTTWQYKCLYGN